MWQSHFSVLCASQGTASGPFVQHSLLKLSVASRSFCLHHLLGAWQRWCGGGAEPTRLALSCYPQGPCDACCRAPAQSRESRLLLGTALCLEGLRPGLPTPFTQSQFRVGAHGAFNTCLRTWLSCQHILGLQSWVISPRAC